MFPKASTSTLQALMYVSKSFHFNFFSFPYPSPPTSPDPEVYKRNPEYLKL